MNPTAPRWLDADEQRAWRAYVQMTELLDGALNRDLQDHSGLSVADFAVLVPLSESAEGAMHAGTLGRAIGWEKSRLSHHLGRMERRGLVRRQSCRTDRRSAVVVLTDQGRSAIEAAAPLHVAAVRRFLFDHLDADAVAALTALAEGTVGRLRPVCEEAVGGDPESSTVD